MRKSSASIEEQWAAGRLGEGLLTEWALQDCVLDTVLHVPLVSLCKCSSHSCKSWLVLQDTVMRSIMFPAAVGQTTGFSWVSTGRCPELGQQAVQEQRGEEGLALMATAEAARQRPHTDLRFQTRAHSLQHLPALSVSFLLKAAFPKRNEQESVSETASCVGIVLLLSADSFLWELPLETNL